MAQKGERTKRKEFPKWFDEAVKWRARGTSCTQITIHLKNLGFDVSNQTVWERLWPRGIKHSRTKNRKAYLRAKARAGIAKKRKAQVDPNAELVEKWANRARSQRKYENDQNDAGN